MSLQLTVDGDRWRTHLRAVAERTPGLTPVCKGNGYGFGLGRLARKAQWLKDGGSGVDTIAVGTYDELPEVETRFDGDLLVLTPWRPWIDARPDPRVVHTVSRLEDLELLLARDPRARIILERLTSMRRHGLSAADLRTAGQVMREAGARPRGVAFHLPLSQGSNLGEVRRLIDDAVAAELDTKVLWVSHLSDSELATLRTSYADFELRPRIGTNLWLGERGALRVTARVLDVHPIERGETFGYRGRSAPKSGHLMIVSGGTAHGIGLESPMGDSSLRSRAATLARGGMDAVGFARSPFTVDGKQRLFAEPPHMQASMLFLPSGARVPAVGDEVEVRVRFTATTFDHVVLD